MNLKFYRYLPNRLWLVMDIPLYIANRIIAYVPIRWLRMAFYRHVLGYQIEKDCAIFMGVWFDSPKGLRMGEHSVINQGCRLDTRGGIDIAANVSISAEVCILTADHNPQSPCFAGRVKSVKIDEFVFIGTRAIILPGVTLGRGSVVAAGAIVTKNVAPFSIVAGSPAKQIGLRNQNLDYQLNYNRFLW